MMTSDSPSEAPESPNIPYVSEAANLVSENQQEPGKTQSSTATATKTDDPDNEIEPATNFVTTSYVLDNLNSALDKLNPPTSDPHSAPGEKRTFFELQKRLPDGSTRKATGEEMSSTDMKNKLEQAAKYTEKMTLEQKIEWAQKQRQHGNQLYQDGNYKEAIDIYLTCLVVRDTSQQELDQEVLMLPVMNNLAQCTLQLGWYQKTEHFCSLAMESLEDATSKGPLVAKLYFKRAKARRLRGMYKEAKLDLDVALLKLGVSNGNDSDTKTPEQKAIEHELQLLAKATKEGKKNKQRAQRAMQRVLGTNQDEKKVEERMEDSEQQEPSKQHGATKTKGNEALRSDTNDNDMPLYSEKHARTHSTIRKRPEGPPPYERIALPVDLSYWQMYRLIMARVAQRILDFIGEDEGAGFGGGSVSKVDDGVSTDRLKED